MVELALNCMNEILLAGFSWMLSVSLKWCLSHYFGSSLALCSKSLLRHMSTSSPQTVVKLASMVGRVSLSLRDGRMAFKVKVCKSQPLTALESCH